jgi:hypothetical protein
MFSESRQLCEGSLQYTPLHAEVLSAVALPLSSQFDMNLGVPQELLNSVMEKIPTPGDNQTLFLFTSVKTGL